MPGFKPLLDRLLSHPFTLCQPNTSLIGPDILVLHIVHLDLVCVCLDSSAKRYAGIAHHFRYWTKSRRWYNNRGEECPEPALDFTVLSQIEITSPTGE